MVTFARSSPPGRARRPWSQRDRIWKTALVPSALLLDPRERGDSGEVAEGISAAAPTPRRGSAAEPELPPPPPVETSEPAVQMLALSSATAGDRLHHEDLSAYATSRSGRAVRGMHESCREALEKYVTLEPIIGSDEGGPVTVPEGFDRRRSSSSATSRGGRRCAACPAPRLARGGGQPAARTTCGARVGAPAEVEIS